MAAISTDLVGPDPTTFTFGARQAHAVTLSGPGGTLYTYEVPGSSVPLTTRNLPVVTAITGARITGSACS